jgi:ketosteroid isomerase-like protein
MAAASNAEVAEKFFKALNDRAYDVAAEFVSPDVVYEIPQSGERIRGLVNVRAVLENYPGPPTGEVKRVHGAEDRWVLSPSWTPLRITGSGDAYTVEARTTYPNGEVWNSVHILEFRDGKISRATDYYAPRLAASEWRSKWVEKVESPTA